MRDQEAMAGPAAYACVHVVRDGAPPLFVSHREPVGEYDSGWSFGCGEEGHSYEDWMMVSAQRLFDADTDLDPLRGMPVGHGATRADLAADWEVFPIID